MRIIITRHGETEENKTGIAQGHLHGQLSYTGKKQARKLAERLKNEKIDIIVSSDLARATDTAKEIAKFHKNITLKISEKLRERNLGILAGKFFEKENTANEFTQKDFKKYAESDESVISRAKDVIDEIIKSNMDNILIVGHNSINKVIIGLLLGKNDKEIWGIKSQGNTAITIFEGDKDNLKLKLMNCAEHLK